MKISSILLFLLLSQLAVGNEALDLFGKANTAYQTGNFAEAIALYEEVIKLDFQSAELEYNLGNAYFRQANLGKAILHYERAAILKPGDADIRHNLAVARDQVSGDIDVLPEFFLNRWWKNIRRLAFSGGWGIIALVLWWMAFAGFSLWLLGKNRRQKKAGFIIGAACIALSFLPYALAFSKLSYEQNTNTGIVMEEAVRLRSAPDDSGKEIMLLPEGLKANLLDRIEEWVKVRLPNGEEGWLEAKAFEEI
jgi:tetratricopeptide (TPR) repeat protein